MACFSSHDAAQALQLLAHASIDRRNELEAFDYERPENSDEDNGTDAPIFDRFYDEGGAEAIVEMTNFNPTQFIVIWAGFEVLVLANCNVGRGRKCAQNKFISSDRIFVENYFGRLCGLWSVLGSKWKWSEINYDPIFRLCLGLTNFHIRWKPLRDGDVQLYHQLTSRGYHIGNSQLERRRKIQKRYRQRRADFVQRQFCAEGVRELFERQPSESL